MKRMLVLFVMLVLIPGLLVFPADVVKKSTNVTTVKGTLRNMMDAKMPNLDQLTTPRQMRAILNLENPRKIVRHSTTPDATIVDEPTLDPKAPKDVTSVAGFGGMSLTANGAGWPPDTNGAIGPNHYIETVNTSIGIYNKSTGAVISTTTFNNFFGGTGITGTPCDANNMGDPIVLYDRYAQRWILFDFCWYSTYSGGSWFAVAASQTSDPTGAWYQYAFNADPTNMNDYPKAGIWHDGIYVTANMFQFSGSFLGVKTWVWKKPDIYNGTLTSLSVFDNSYYAWSLLPSNAVGSTAPTGPNYLFSIDADEYGSPSTDAIPWWTCAVNWTTNTLTWTYKGLVSVSAYSIVSTGVPQKGTTKKLDSLYGRPMYSATYREPGKAYLCHVAEANSCRSTRYYELNVSTTSLTIARQATLPCADGYHRWMASICADKNGDIALGYSLSSSAKYPSIYVRDVIAGTEYQVKAGAGYQKTYTRWGDYSMMDIDAADDETFWYTNEYYAVSGTNWQTWIAHFKI